MEPHHGSSNDGCNFWLANIIKLSGDNFVGVIQYIRAISEEQKIAMEQKIIEIPNQNNSIEQLILQ